MSLIEFKNRVRNRVYKLLDSFIVPFLSRRGSNLYQCSQHGLWDGYFTRAENQIEDQWKNIIWPIIQHCDFSHVLEIACGAGRNTELLAKHASNILATDLNAYALQKARSRLGNGHLDCKINYFQNDGTTIPIANNESITLVYCWDAAVHFDRSIIESYLKEFSRVLKPEAKGFIHHSTLGEKADINIKKNPHWRSNMSRELFAAYCDKANLRVLDQIDIPWGEVTDCITLFEKPTK